MVKVLRALIIPFGAIFVLLAIYDFNTARRASRDFSELAARHRGTGLHLRPLGSRLDRVRQ